MATRNKPIEAKEPAETLDAYIRRHEREANERGIVVARIDYPGAEARVYPGTYAGIRVLDGDLSATYSDGSKH